ncbi:anthrax toxin receptor-like [Callorhinus ursinus]|uniref:anthrax toxin receptor-like n=1 Tax=Callorhinus ursinus TaxID=34884 RepID=UPI003CD00CA9
MASTNLTPAPAESGASGAAKKIGSSSIWVPGPALSLLLLLLLLLPPPLLSTGSFLHRLPAWRDFHHGTMHHRSKAQKLGTCEGAFNLFFLLDTSETAKESWKEIHKLVEELLKKFTNPSLRISIITYSSQSNTQMKLTPDRQVPR